MGTILKQHTPKYKRQMLFKRVLYKNKIEKQVNFNDDQLSRYDNNLFKTDNVKS